MKLGEGTTPGPWRVGDAGNTVFGPPNGNPAPEVIANRGKNKANIALLAKAPLLIECRDVLERTHVHYCGKRFSYNTGDHCCEIGALLAKLES